jgi:hypothetical protein
LDKLEEVVSAKSEGNQASLILTRWMRESWGKYKMTKNKKLVVFLMKEHDDYERQANSYEIKFMFI